MSIHIVILFEFIKIQKYDGIGSILLDDTLYIVFIIESGEVVGIFYLDMFQFFFYTLEKSRFFEEFLDFLYFAFRCIFIPER